MKKFWLYITLVTLSIAGFACGVQPAEGAFGTSAGVSSPVAQQLDDENNLLLWEGATLFAENPAECYRLRITSDNKAFTGPCDGVQTEIPFAGDNAGGFTEMLTRFAPFALNRSNERLVFNGQGQISGPEWQRAITGWAQTTQAQLATGHVGAANNTVLAWNLGQEADQCRMVLVLAYGYATAALNPCGGGQMQVLASEWIDPVDWSQFDSWLYTRAPFYQENSYFDGRGTDEMNAAEADTLATWAEKVYARLVSTRQAGLAPTTEANAPVECLTPGANQQLWLDEANGYCLLYPADYGVAQSAEGINLVKGDIMNHIDPRLSIVAEAAAGRTLEKVATQIEVDYVPSGFEVVRETTTIDGVEAVMLDNLPGQDLNRRVVFIQNGQLYNLFLAPLGDEGSDVRQQAEALYQQAINSFRFFE